MTYEDIWTKIREFAVWFFHFAMNEGENKFMLVDADFLHAYRVSSEVQWMFFITFAVVALIAIFASDSFHPFKKELGIFMWFKKISVFKVTVFAAAVFSLHTFYKMLITIVGSLTGANASVLALECLGSYINPFSVCILSIAVSTLPLVHKRRQAFFLGLSVFLTPAILTFNTITMEHLVVYAVGICISAAAAVLYSRFSMYGTYAAMSVVYLISKYFLIFYSGKVLLLSEPSAGGKFIQFLSCMELDIVLTLILALILLGYKEITVEKSERHLKKDIAAVSVMAVVAVGSLVSNNTAYVYAGTPAAYPVLLTLVDLSLMEEETEEDINYIYEPVGIEYAESSSHLTTSSGTVYDISLTYDGDPATCWQDGAESAGEGEILSYYLPDVYQLGKLQIVNGNHRSAESYEENCRIASADVYFYLDGSEIAVETLTFEDNYNQEYMEFTFNLVPCDNIQFVVTSVYQGSIYNDLCVSEVEFYKATAEE